MLQFIVGWVKGRIFQPVTKIEPEKLSPSQLGYRFEHDELKRLMYRLRNFETVAFEDVSGTKLTPESIDKRFGKDGGIDCVIRVVAPTSRGADNVAARIRNILIRGDY